MRAMRHESRIATAVLATGVLLLLWGVFSYPREPQLGVAGAVLIGSWLISRAIREGGQ